MVEARLPPGFRFHPRDHELVLDYLCHKLSGGGGRGGGGGGVDMVDVDLNKCEPWELPGTIFRPFHDAPSRRKTFSFGGQKKKNGKKKYVASPGFEPETFSVLD